MAQSLHSRPIFKLVIGESMVRYLLCSLVLLSFNVQANLLTEVNVIGSPKAIETPISPISFQIDSNDDSLTLSDDQVDLGSGDFAVSLWFRLEETATGHWRSVVHKGDQNSDRTFGMWMDPNSDRLMVTISTSTGNVNASSTAIIPLNQWTHILYSKQGNLLKLYINGQADVSVSLSSPVVFNTGAVRLGTDTWHAPAKGSFASFDVYSRLVSSLEAKSLYQAQFSNHSIENTAHLSGSPNKVLGKDGIGEALQINSSDDYAILPNSINFPNNSANFSVGFWVRVEQGPTGQWRALLHKGNSSTERTFAMWLRPSDNRIHFRISTENSFNEGSDSAAELALNRWTHITYVKEGNTLKLYLDGALDSQVTLTGNVIANSGPLYIGNSPWYQPSLASFDQITTFNRGLKAEAVARLFQTTEKTIAEGGYWGELMPWPHVPVSAANLPDGRILSWSGSERTVWPSTEQTYSATWNPSNNEFLEVFHEGHNMFCAHLAMTEDGQVMVTGGRNQTNSPWASLFDFRDNQWTQVENMATGGRWYPTTLALPSGEIMTSMGTATNFANPEKWSPDNGWSVLNNVNYEQMRQNHDGANGARRWWTVQTVAPNGQVFHFWDLQENHFVNTDGTGSVTNANASSNDPSVAPGVAIQYDEGKLLIAGHNQGSWGGASTFNQAFSIDLNGPTPVISSTDDMNFARVFHNLVPLPTGEVLALGGNTSGAGFSDVGTVYEAEIWNPQTGRWSATNISKVPRNYHSIALLLTDGRVLSAGGGYCSGNEFCNGASHQNGQIFSPPYLFNSDGSLAPRPVITEGPGIIRAGQPFEIKASENIVKFNLIKMSSTTHAVNTDVRFSRVAITQQENDQYTLTPNANGNVLTPGYWMLFGLNDNNVPSVAHVVRVERAQDVTTPGDFRYVKLLAKSSHSSNAIAVDDLVILDANGAAINSSNWRISASSESESHPANLAVDNASATYWQAQSNNVPQDLMIDLRAGYALSGAEYLPVQDASGGRIKDFEVLLSTDGVNWEKVTEGQFDRDATRKNLAFGLGIEEVDIVQGEPAASSSNTSLSVTPIEGLQYRWSFGDGSSQSEFSSNHSVTHVYQTPGRYIVVVDILDPTTGEQRTLTMTQIVYDQSIDLNNAQLRQLSSSSIIYHPAYAQIWNVNPDNNTVTMTDSNSFSVVAELAVGEQPSSLASDQFGNIWVTNKKSGTISIIDAVGFTQTTIALDISGSAPHGIVINNGKAFIALENSQEIVVFDTSTRSIIHRQMVDANPRHLALSADFEQLYVSHFITPPLPGENTDQPSVVNQGGRVSVLSADSLSVKDQIIIHYSDDIATENTGPGLPNYLGALAIHPAGKEAYIPSKQDNILAGDLREGDALAFDQSVRAISSKIDLLNNTEYVEERIDHDNASVATAAAFGPYGIHLFTLLEGNRQVAVSNVSTDSEIIRFDVGRAPRGIAVSRDGTQLAVHNFMSRSVDVIDVTDIVNHGGNHHETIASISTVSDELLDPEVLLGKQLFYDSKDDRLAALDYMSCSSCHSDGAEDGRVWDFTQFGEGLRNTTTLLGKGGMAHGLLHWSANFDEIQDFEGQIRGFAGGTGLMDTSDFLDGTRSQPMGDKKAGLSPDLDALAAYLTSLNTVPKTPYLDASNQLSLSAEQGRELFISNNCQVCHAGVIATDSSDVLNLHDIGSITPFSGGRLGDTLLGFDTPTLIGLWQTPPYLHDGSAETIEQAIAAHLDIPLSQSELVALADFLRELEPEHLPHDKKAPIQAGRIVTDQPNRSVWHTVKFDEPFTQKPIVKLGPASFNGGQALTLRIRNVTSEGFEFKMDEWLYLDGYHIQETIDYLAVEPGVHNWGGLIIQAGEVTANHQWHSVNFSQMFSKKPVVVTQIMTHLGSQPAITRNQKVSISGFELKIDEEEGTDRWHVNETIGFIAIEPGIATLMDQKRVLVGTPQSIDHNWHLRGFTSLNHPLMIGDIQTTNGGDPITLRYRKLTNSNVELMLQEEQAANSEVAHVKELAGWILIEQ